MLFPSVPLADLEQLATQILNYAGSRRKFAFHAPMGFGKTTLISAICRVLGVKDDTDSPTYSIVNEYLSPENGTVRHLDLYRLNGIDEALEIGIEDMLYDNAYCFIEWSDLIADLLPEDTVHCYADENRAWRVE